MPLLSFNAPLARHFINAWIYHSNNINTPTVPHTAWIISLVAFFTDDVSTEVVLQAHDIVKIKQSCYRPGVAQRVPGS
jgi:hypothetical protein